MGKALKHYDQLHMTGPLQRCSGALQPDCRCGQLPGHLDNLSSPSGRNFSIYGNYLATVFFLF